MSDSGYCCFSLLENMKAMTRFAYRKSNRHCPYPYSINLLALRDLCYVDYFMTPGLLRNTIYTSGTNRTDPVIWFVDILHSSFKLVPVFHVADFKTVIHREDEDDKNTFVDQDGRF